MNSPPDWVALVAAVGLAGMATFQTLLAAGLPLGQAAFGGANAVLPARLRVASALRGAVRRGVLCRPRSRRTRRGSQRICPRAHRNLGVRGNLRPQYRGKHCFAQSMGAVPHGAHGAPAHGVLRRSGFGPMTCNTGLTRPYSSSELTSTQVELNRAITVALLRRSP